MRQWILVAAVVAALTAAPAVTAAPEGSSWVRKEGRNFIVYVPDDTWNFVESQGGVDVSSGAGEYEVGFGFTGWLSPVKNEDVAAYLLRAGALDAHVLNGIRYTSKGRKFALAKGIIRQIYEWRATRTDTHESARGVLTIDVFNSPATATYGFDWYGRAAPVADWAKIAPTLLLVQKRIIYKPRPAAACAAWRPGCRSVR